MNTIELKRLIADGALEKYSNIYSDVSAQTKRHIGAIDCFVALFGEGEAEIFSTPGRSEISGNHTDHNRGIVLAGAIDRDIIAVARPNAKNKIRLKSEGYERIEIDLSKVENPDGFPNFTSVALIAGIAGGFVKNGYNIGGFDAYLTTEVLRGSGISSSAAFEVMIGNILNYLYNDGRIKNEEIAKIAQFSENVYFGKPSGLMDQVACAVGGFVYIDFKTEGQPIIEPIDFSLKEKGYSLCIVNTGGNHANLNDDYASVPKEMRAVANELGKGALAEVCEDEIIKNIPTLRNSVGDRAILRALHFVRECERVKKIKAALLASDTEEFLRGVRLSGLSSFQYLQNVYTNTNVGEQGLSLALALTDGFLNGRSGACRVHGGGFAGTIQAFIKNDDADEYVALMDSVFGKGATSKLNIRPLGACKLF